jgi:hypothetical protein
MFALIRTKVYSPLGCTHRGHKEINTIMGKNNWQLPLRKVVQWAVDVAHGLWKITKTPKQRFAGEVRGRWWAPQARWIKMQY